MAWLDELRSGDFFVHGAGIAPSALQQLRMRYVIREVPPHFRQIYVYEVGPAVPGG